MRKLWILGLLLSHVAVAQDYKPEDTEVWEPEPKVITGVKGGQVPSDAIVLFDGSDFDAWRKAEAKEPIAWDLIDGRMQVAAGTGAIMTNQNFGSIQLHVEWKAPAVVKGDGQGRGNSGIFLQSRYEVQVLDSYDNRTYSNGQAASIYKQYAPLVNVMNPPTEWQSYDIIFTAPEFDDKGDLLSPAYVTVLHNGVLVQNHVEIKGSTEYIGPPSYQAHGDAPIMLQDHGNPVSFRNIWVREL
ncbi:3-keto-disaccharide hydrolase [Reichenbachiella ulvae]|uniref:DUF1080 domain-containing protein n=1 Tax=Reichenbachiella ulvae TaxID=2980104 RepID=A0ABT3CVV6_9BACT|nr:DUF1080 domain-containing protein [Reichenbachiella ulvae]MCV9387837.1 DUF1080 domain-containing protein [Reichenbachiella ulvae]